ncbi:protein ALWAYS EARLY 3-like [Lycium ferocissimum]|uniref:protein ALWAYS EARLY 3-like n=1 Tax=Lycium ferocissimum TaxID=112874 RepID=UPI00281573A3|nr:protein ALWAYS EARLY 3-like [Lycium ferocissimum]
MAPAKKSRSVNKRFSRTTEISPSKDGNGDNLKKSLQRKRKLSDMLGPEWSEEDLTRFYKAYRKYGKDWKKVAAAVKPRTAEMVEALYTMNRAYLSLPEGTASVVGLIAMMTDHYCNLAASDSEQESNEDAGTSRKPQKRARVKIQPDVSKTSEAASPTLAATHGCLTLLKKKRSGGSRPRAVGKRTPRFPVSFSYENPMGKKYFSPSRRSLKPQADDTDDDMKIALVLTEASQRGGSPQVSRTLNRWEDSALSSPNETAERKRIKMGTGNGKLLSNEVDEEEGSMEADTGELLRYKNDLADTGTISRTAQKGRRRYGEKLEVDDSGNNHFDDIKEACSGTEGGQRLGAVRGKLEMEATDEKNSRTFLQGFRKRSKKVLLRRDEDSPFDALQTLADLSLMMPTTENEDGNYNFCLIDLHWYFYSVNHTLQLRLSPIDFGIFVFCVFHKTLGPLVNSLGTWFITCVYESDFDCMPLNPSENMPTSLKRHADAVDKFFESFNELKVNVRANEILKFPAGDNMENGDVFSHFSAPTHPISNLLKQTKVASAEADMQCKSGVPETATYQQKAYLKSSVAAQIQAKEADVQALVELTRALDKKDAVVSELRRMNDDVLENQKSNGCFLKDPEPFQKQYAAVLIQLNEVNEQVSSALYRLRQRNTYQGGIPLAWPRPVTNFVDPSVLCTFDRGTSQPQESVVNEIIESSKIKSRTMVDAAVQAMLSLSGREKTIEKIEEAIDYVNDWIPLDDSCMPTAPDPKSKNMSDRNEAEIPSELITKCVATLLMIQKCTERQFPPADVAKVLDSALASLQPCCSQNFPVYGEIQKCMGIIRNQILALVPT